MKLPNADRAVVDIRKLQHYCLDAGHPRGKHKARRFEEALGLRQEDAEELRSAILRHVPDGYCEQGEFDQYGRRFAVEFDYSRQGMAARVRTCWIVRTGEEFPRLTTCFIA